MADLLKEEDPKDDVVIVEDEKLLTADHDDDDDDDIDPDQPDKVSTAADEDREAIRERRRLEKIERKERRDKAITRDKVELGFLRKRNDELERRMSAQEQRALQGDLNNLDANIQAAMREADLSERVIAKAVEAGNGQDVAQAMRYRDQALAKVQQLNGYKQQVAQRPAQAPAIDSQTMHHAKAFLTENAWYDPAGRDEDSAIVLAIDQALAKDGFNPQTEEYWGELRKRASRRLPERFSKDDRVARGGPAVGSGREHAPTSTRKEIYLSPERKQALVDAGVWDDPVLRMKYAKRYAEYDRNNRA